MLCYLLIQQKHILSESGRRLAQDIRLLADSTQRTLNEKFDGGKLVEELWDARKGIKISTSGNGTISLLGYSCGVLIRYC